MFFKMVVNDAVVDGSISAATWQIFKDWADNLDWDPYWDVVELASRGECPRLKRLYTHLNRALADKPPRRSEAREIARSIRDVIKTARKKENECIRILGGEYDELREQIRQATMYNNATTVDDERAEAESEGGYYQFLDRDVVDPMLEMTWAEYLRHYGIAKGKAREVISFCVEPMPDKSQISDILARRTLRWTMGRSKPQYHFLAEALDPLRYEGAGSPSVGCCPDDTAVVLAVAVEAYLRKQIDRPTLHSVYKINAIDRQTDWLEISDDDRRAAFRGWRPAKYGPTDLCLARGRRTSERGRHRSRHDPYAAICALHRSGLAG